MWKACCRSDSKFVMEEVLLGEITENSVQEKDDDDET